MCWTCPLAQPGPGTQHVWQAPAVLDACRELGQADMAVCCLWLSLPRGWPRPPLMVPVHVPRESAWLPAQSTWSGTGSVGFPSSLRSLQDINATGHTWQGLGQVVTLRMAVSSPDQHRDPAAGREGQVSPGRVGSRDSGMTPRARRHNESGINTSK